MNTTDPLISDSYCYASHFGRFSDCPNYGYSIGGFGRQCGPCAQIVDLRRKIAEQDKKYQKKQETVRALDIVIVGLNDELRVLSSPDKRKMTDKRWSDSGGSVRHYFKQDDELFYVSLCGHLRLKTELGNQPLPKCKVCLRFGAPVQTRPAPEE